MRPEWRHNHRLQISPREVLRDLVYKRHLSRERDARAAGGA
jgi:hypothetical protein